MSVNLNEIKKTKGSQFHLSTSNSDLRVNIALKAKFEKDFGMVLSDVEEEDTPEKKAREAKEIAYMHNTWQLHTEVDPAYSPWLTAQKEDFSFVIEKR